MATVLRRETFIALRARRQAYRIASEIINPHIKDNRPPDEPKTPINITLPALARQAMSPLARWTLLVLAAVGIGLVMTVFLLRYRVL